jgi:hypothetical protein
MTKNKYVVHLVISALAVIVIAACTPAALRFIRFMMLPETPPFDLAISFSGLSSTQDPLSVSDTAIDEQTSRTLAQMDLHGRRHAPQTYLAFTTTNPTADVRILMLAQEPVTQNADLALPSKGSTVYLLRNGTWRAYPSIIDPAQQRIYIDCDPSVPGRFTLYVTGIQPDTRTRVTLSSPMGAD